MPAFGRRLLPLLGAAAAPPTGCAGLRDLMPGFWSIHDRAAGTRIERGRALVADFVQPNIEAYRAAGIGRVDLALWLERFDGIAGQVRALSRDLPVLWCARQQRFREALPDAAATVPTVALPSFWQFDGRTRLVGGTVTLFLGPDMIALLHGDAPGPFLDHERFHLYHHEVNPSLILPGGDPLWLGIWKEGLAVHATAVLNPGLARRAVFLGDAELAEAAPALLRRVAGELTPERLAATDAPTRARYLNYGYRGDIPARLGYALGLAIVEGAAQGRDLAALARIPAGEVQAIVTREVAALAR